MTERPPPVRLHDDAVAEARSAYEWYRARNPAAAERFVRELETGIAGIGESPSTWTPYLGGTRRYLFFNFPFFIVFRETSTAIRILAVAHGSRRPGYWRSRQ